MAATLLINVQQSRTNEQSIYALKSKLPQCLVVQHHPAGADAGIHIRRKVGANLEPH